MAYTVECPHWMDPVDIKKTLAKLHLGFLFVPFMSMSQVLKIIVVNVDAAEVYATNGNVYVFRLHPDHPDRLEQVDCRTMGS